MTTKFKYEITIPSIDIIKSIEIKDLCLIGSNDERYNNLKKENQYLSKYLESFKTPFNKEIFPSIIIRPESLPRVDSDYLTAFRNVIAVSCVIYSRVQSCLSDNTIGFTCTDLFDFYPVSVSNTGNDLMIETAQELGLDRDLDKFMGQSTPNVIYPHHINQRFDDDFLKSLLDLVEKNYRLKVEKEFKNKVLRSLEMAYYALRTPFSHFGNKTDFGIPISLWVSAFEILSHPPSGNVNFSHVSNLIKRVNWQSNKLKIKSYVSYICNSY